MRIASWNCRSGDLRRRAAELSDRFDPDIAILQECCLAGSLQNDQCLWVGRPQRGRARCSGVGVMAKHNWMLRRGPIVEDLADFFLPVEILGSHTLRLLAVCIMSKPYMPKLFKALDAYQIFLRSLPSMVVGDFNISPSRASDKTNYPKLSQRLKREFGLMNASEGRTCDPTYFHGREHTPHHIDHCFVPAEPVARVQAVEIGQYDHWISTKKSDHCPVVVDLQFNFLGDRTPKIAAQESVGAPLADHSQTH